MKYQIVSSYPEVSGEEYDIANKMLNWINESKIYNTDLDFGTDVEFVPTIPDDSAGTFLTPKESLPKADPIKVSKTEGESTISFNDPKSFVESFYNIYINRGINPELAEVLSVQKLLESRKKNGNGFTVLAKEFNNFGGIKAGKDSPDYYTSETDEYINGSKERITDKFRKFSSIDDYLDYETKYIYGDMGNFNGALSGDVDHYFNTILGGRLKYATSPYYRDTLEDLRNRYFGVRNVKKGGILKLQQAGSIIPDFSKMHYTNNGSDIDYETRREYDMDQVSAYDDRYYDIINNRVRDAEEALVRNGFEYNVNFLKHLLAAQSIRETGWQDRMSNNNYGGYLDGDNKKIRYPSKEVF